MVAIGDSSDTRKGKAIDMFHWKDQFAVAYPYHDKDGKIVAWRVSAHVGQASPIVVAWKTDDKSGMTGKQKADWLVKELNQGAEFWSNKKLQKIRRIKWKSYWKYIQEKAGKIRNCLSTTSQVHTASMHQPED